MRRGDARLLDLDYLLSLRARSVRDAHGLFLVEGVRAAGSALDQGADVLSLVVCPSLLRSSVGQIVARRRRQLGCPTLRVAPAEFARLAVLAVPQGIAAVVRQRWHGLPDQPGRGLWLAFEQVASPGNLGSALRTASATGGKGAVLLGPEADAFDPSVVRATMGAHFRLRFVRTDSSALRAWKERTGCKVIGVSPDAADDFRRGNYRGRTILMIGGERRGLTAGQRALCDRIVRIPMEPGVDSLNTAVAASIVLYEAYRQRRGVPAEAT